MTELEKTVEAEAKNLAKALGGESLKWVSPGFNGVPDQVLLLPGGVFAAYECKREGEPLRALQHKRIKRLRALGFTVGIVRCRADMVRLIREAQRNRANPPTDKGF